MSSRDERVVEMKFDNAQFERGVAQTQASLNSLNQSLQNSHGAKAFEGISQAAKKVDLMYIANDVQQIASKFTLLGVIGMKVMDEIAMYTINVFKGIWNATFGQIKSGGIKRAMNIENAHFMLQGLLKDEKEVQRIMNLASKSVDGTAYSYDSAAKAASQFAASGIRGNEELEVSLRAITGVAAMTNSEYEDISRIFTTVAGNGRLMGDQLLQLSSRGMNAAATLADFFNGINDGSKTASEGVTEYVKSITNGTQIAEADIRDMVSKGKIDFATFSAAMDEAFGEHALKANETFTGAMSNVRAALSRIGAKFVSPLIVQNGQVVQMLNSLRLMINAINKEMDPFANAFVNFVVSGADALKYFMDNLNVSDLFKGFAEALRIVNKLLSPIGKAFREAFIITDGEAGVNTIDKINAAITRFREKLESIKPYHATLTKIQNTFAGVFAVVKIGLQIISALVQTLLPVKNTISGVHHGILDLTSSWGEWLVNLEKTLRESNFFIELFGKIKDVVLIVFYTLREVFKGLMEIIEPYTESISGFFTKLWEQIKAINFDELLSGIKGVFTGELSSENIDNSTRSLSKFQKVLEKIKEIFGKIGGSVKEFIGGLLESIDTTSASSMALSGLEFILEGIAKAVEGALTLLTKFGGALRKGIGSFLENFTFDKLISLITSGLFIKALSDISNIMSKFVASIWSDDLSAISKSIGILTLSIIGLSMIDTDKLGIALGAITALFTELTAAYMLMTNGLSIDASGVASGDPMETKLGRFLGTFTGLNRIGGLISAVRKKFEMEAIKKIAEGVVLLAAAMAILSFIDVEGLAKGLTAISILMAELALFAKMLSKLDTTSFLGTGGGILMMAGSLVVMTAAIAKLGNMDMNTLVHGFLSVELLLLSMVSLVKKLKGVDIAVTGGVFIGLATGILILSVAIKKIGSLDMGTIAKGLGGIAGGLLLMVASLKALTDSSTVFQNGDIFFAKQSGSLLKTAASITIMAVALNLFASALEKIGGMSWEEIAKGLVGIAGALLSIMVAFNYIDNDQLLRTSFAFTIVADAMIILSLSLMMIGSMDWENLVKGLIGFAGALAMVVVALSALSGGSEMLKTKDIFFSKQQGSMIKSAASIAIVAGSMLAMGGALKLIGSMDWDDLIKGLVGVGAAMAMIVLALNNISNDSLAKAGGFAAMAASLTLLVPPFLLLGALSLEQIMRSLIAMAGALVVLKAAAVGLGPMANDLMAVSSAMALFGVGVAAVGVGILALAVAFEALVHAATSVPGAISIMADVVITCVGSIIKTVGDTIGYLLVGIAKGVVDALNYLGQHQDELVAGITGLFTVILAALVELVAGGIYSLVLVMVETFERLTNDDLTFRLIDSFFTLLHQVLIGLEAHVDELVTDLVRLIVLVIYSLVKNLKTILTAAAVFVVQFIKGLAAVIVEQSGPLVEAVMDVVMALAYLILEVLKQTIGKIPGLAGIFEKGQQWLVDHMSEEAGQKIIENYGRGVKKGLDEWGGRWAAASRSAAMLIMNEMNGTLANATLVGPSQSMVGFQTAQHAPMAYYYNQKGHNEYNPDTDYSLLNPPSIDNYPVGYSNMDSYGRGTKDAAEKVGGIISDSGDSFISEYASFNPQMYGIGGDGIGELGSGWQNGEPDYLAILNGTGQASVGTLSYYIPQYGAAGSQSILKYGEMQLAGTGEVVKASDKVAGASVGKIAEYYSRYSQTGSKNVDAYIASVYAGKGDAEKAGGGVGSSNVYGLASVNPALKATGSDAIANYAGGIAGAVGKSTSAAAGVASESVDSAGVYKDEFWVAGNQATIGFANGITEMISKAISAAGSVARAALSQLKAVLGIHSPSRAFMEAGEYSGEGFVIGLQSYESVIGKESVKIADISINALAEGMKQISEIADNDMNYEPTIKPVFDFTDVNTGISTLNGLMTSNSAIAASATFDMNNQQNDILGQIVAENSRHEEVIDGIINRQTTALNDIRRLLANQVIVLDSGELIGQTIQKIDGELNNLMTYKERGN